MNNPTPELRALRLWHWRKAKHAGAQAERLREGQAGRLIIEEAANVHAFHMRAVQALNDCFPTGDTAESDEV